MQYFKTCAPDDDSQGELSECVIRAKNVQEGDNEMMRIEDEIYMAGRTEGEEEGVVKGIAGSLVNLMKNARLSLDEAMKMLCVPPEEKSDYADIIGKLYPDFALNR